MTYTPKGKTKRAQQHWSGNVVMVISPTMVIKPQGADPPPLSAPRRQLEIIWTSNLKYSTPSSPLHGIAERYSQTMPIISYMSSSALAPMWIPPISQMLN